MRTNILVIPILFLLGCGGSPEPPQSESAVQVTVAPARLAPVARMVEAPATLYPVREAHLSARLTAPVLELYVQKGDRVQKDQLLIQLENRDLEAERRQASAAVADAEANLQRLQSGTLPADIEQARGRLRSAEATLHQAEQVYQRRSELFQEGAIPERELLMSRTDLEKAQAEYDSAEKALDVLVHQTQGQDVKMAELRLEQQQANLELLKTQLSFTQIRSPFPGTVTEQSVYPGDLAQPGTPLLTISDLSTVVARAQVPEAQAHTLELSQSCSFESADLPDIVLEGEVSVINKAVDPLSRTVEMWCQIDHPGNHVRGGIYGRTSVVTATDEVVLVPRSAIQFETDSKQGTAFVVDENQIAHQRQVEAGEFFGDDVEIKSGLQPGEKVIVEGAYGLPDGSRVEVQKAAQS